MEDKLNDEGERRLNVSGVLRVLGVSRNGYYSYRKRLPSDRQKRKEAIMEKIMAIYNESHQNYGAPKITKVLQSEGEKISEKTVGNYMHELGIRAQYVKPYTVTTIDSDFSLELKNILDEEFNPSEPNAVWCSDITYIWTYEGFVYLTSIMDLFSRKIIAWELSTTLEAKWVVETINRAKKARRIDKPLVMHSDRGIQYTCSAYKEATEGLINSYSKKAFPWDNACIESFHALIKREWINRFKILDYNHAYRLVFEYIEAFYNTVRIHSHCGYLSPNQYEVNYAKQLVKLYRKVS
ncbi:IS3 family transposase [Lachnospiraceae bacterium MD1]|uniref:IS3 family transposase n=1 Tax=Variimorphobacter saccharofermentans TaxID=2755051 RepID=A0A839K1L2_9FIRM|nr:IS3 family transposase [Variimorphobacter saccharofermentans]MBB2183490.1 IS3 family transposase [Variimorphobacter saccharofermentans]MBB2183516.1 IS3 family transposase [Variimorphobacter saccharofermentans]